MAAGLATFIILNSEGWVATAAHVLFAQREARLTDRCVWFTTDAIKATANFHIDHRADLAIGQLSGLDLSGVREYPKFGNGELIPGTGLSHWGFPWYGPINAAFDAQTRQFRVDSYPPIPLIPTAGIFTVPMLIEPNGRLTFLGPRDSRSGRKFFQTSAPILDGQSGGPVVDTEGHLWGLSSMGSSRYTGHKSTTGEPGASLVPQFVTYALASDVENLIQLMNKHGVRMQENS
ncbi:MAG: serine protease [Bryobacteraceae bacterium]